jgi:isocitrate lyase
MQYFKGDDLEKKYDAVAEPLLTELSEEKDAFFEGAYTSFPFGDLIWTQELSPLSKAILQSIFRETYPDIFAAFAVAGSFESYLDIFRKIFGTDVEVTFTVPAAGKLTIAITAVHLEISEFGARRVVDGAYVFDEVITRDGDTLVFQGVKGFQSQYELEQMLFELVPAGIFTDISLTLGA